MKISEINAWVVSVPAFEEWLSSPEFGKHGNPKAPRTLLRIRDGEGFEGWGEMAGDQLSALEEIKAHLLGREPGRMCLNLLDLWEKEALYWGRPAKPSPYAPPRENLRHRLRHPLQSLVEFALTDLLARRAGVSVSQFFGGRWREEVLTDYWAGRVTPEHAARCALRGRELGFYGIKLKTTLEDPNVERLEAIRDAVGEDFHVTVDPNGRFYRFDDAWKTVQAMEGVGNMGILEDPFPRFYLQDFAALRPRLNARLVVHIDPVESLWQVLSSGVAGGVNLDSVQTGPSQWRMMAGTVEQANLPLWHGSGHDLGIGTAWHLQLAASAPNCRLPGDQSSPWLREHTLVTHPFEVRNGGVVVPTGAGIGVEADLDAIDRYCQRHQAWE